MKSRQRVQSIERQGTSNWKRYEVTLIETDKRNGKRKRIIIRQWLDIHPIEYFKKLNAGISNRRQRYKVLRVRTFRQRQYPQHKAWTLTKHWAGPGTKIEYACTSCGMIGTKEINCPFIIPKSKRPCRKSIE